MGLRICVVTAYPPSRGRLSEYSHSLLKELEKSPKIDRIFAVTDSTPDFIQTPNSKIELYPIWRPNNPFSILRIIPTIAALRPHVVHFNVHFRSFGTGRIANFLGLALPAMTRLMGLASVVTVHNLGEHVTLDQIGIKSTFINRVGLRIATRLLTLADLLTVTVRSYVAFLQESHSCQNVIFIPHGARECPERYEVVKNPHRYILFLGHMSPYKGLPMILEAFKNLRKRMDVKLVIAGDEHPNFRGYMKRFKSKHSRDIEYTGYVEEEDLPILVSGASIVVLPYLTGTGTSGVFHLACAFGKAIVASDLPEIRELTEEGAAASLVKPGDTKALEKAIERLLDSDALACEMGEHNRRFASSETLRAVATEFVRLYEQAVNG
jgi:glycosyltransferase involved in cell wall biosynthesis